MATAGLTSFPPQQLSAFGGACGKCADASTTTEMKKNGAEVDSVLARSLKNENDLLRFQLNDIILREKHQRIELQRLRSHRDVEVSQMVTAATTQLKSEVDQLKGLLQSTSAQLLQALTEKEKVVSEKEQAVQALEEVRHDATVNQSNLQTRAQHLDEVVNKSVAMTSGLADFIDSFQRHVLPTFNPATVDNKSSKAANDPGGTKSLVEELKQENEELKAELQLARERDSKHKVSQQQPVANTNNDMGFEKNMLRQELHSLQNLFNAEVKQLKAKLKMYEMEDRAGHGRFEEVQKKLLTMQNKLVAIEKSRGLLESRLKEETSARSQLVSQLFTLRKENEKLKTELDTLKLNQKFLVRQPRSGRIPVEKMDLMNTMNQLLLEMNKLKGDKVSLEEELKVQRRSQVREHVERTVTARDVAMAASNKVGDSELASKLATSRLQQLGHGSLSELSLTNNGEICNGMAMIDMM